MSLSIGVSVQGGLCPGVSLSRGSPSRGSLARGVSVTENPSTVEEWVVRILLECILVYVSVSAIFNHLSVVLKKLGNKHGTLLAKMGCALLRDNEVNERHLMSFR